MSFFVIYIVMSAKIKAMIAGIPCAKKMRLDTVVAP